MILSYVLMIAEWEGETWVSDRKAEEIFERNKQEEE